jgi:antitoxin CptB
MVTTEVKNNNLDKIRWNCRRGMLELDKILISFFDVNYADLPEKRQIQFEELLSKTDQNLYDWLVLGVNLPVDNASLQDFILVIRYFSSKTMYNELACGLN